MLTKRSSPVAPNSGETPVSPIWSVIAITEPGPASSRRLPAALVRTSASQPSAASVRTGTAMASARPDS